VFVNAVDDPANATAFLSGVIRREGVTLAISTSGEAPRLTALLRQGIDELLPRRDLANWVRTAREQRRQWKADGVPMDDRRPLLLRALNELYSRDDDEGQRAEGTAHRALSPTLSPLPSALCSDR